MSNEPMHKRFSIEAKQRILNNINNANGFSLTFEDVVLSPPNFTGSQSNTGTNSVLTVIATGKTHISGRFDWHYNREDIDKVFGSKGIVVYVDYNAKHSTDLLLEMSSRYGVLLTPDDIIVEKLPSLENGDTPYLLKISPMSVGWYGSLQILIRPRYNNLGLATIINKDCDKLTIVDGKGVAELVYPWKALVDVKHYDKLLSTDLRVGSPIDQTYLIDIVKSLFGDQWHWLAVRTEDYNLYGSSIAYLGPNEGRWALGGDPNDVTLGIKLGHHCNNLSGFLLIKLPISSINFYMSTVEGKENDEEDSVPVGDGTQSPVDEGSVDGEDGPDPVNPEEPEPIDPESQPDADAPDEGVVGEEQSEGVGDDEEQEDDQEGPDPEVPNDPEPEHTP